MNPDEITPVNGGRPLVFRNATVLTMDAAGVHRGRRRAGHRRHIAAVGPHLEVPDGTRRDRRAPAAS